LCEKEKISDKKNISKKELFLTFEGMVRLLYVSRSNNAQKFRSWATETLFAAKMGTNDQKNDLVSKVMGVSANTVKEVFKTSATTIPCVYLYVINNVKELRTSMEIDEKHTDDILICKYGFTSDLPRRTTEHINTYGSIKGSNLKLKYYSYIDPMYISNAESDIRESFTALNIGFAYKNYNELVIIKPSLLKSIEGIYRQLGNAYAGHIKDMIKQIEDLKKEMELKEEKYKNEIHVKENISNLLKKDLVISEEKHKNELLIKENNLLKKDIVISEEKHKNELLIKENNLLKKRFGNRKNEE
jgi:hypothetical protein